MNKAINEIQKKAINVFLASIRRIQISTNIDWERGRSQIHLINSDISSSTRDHSEHSSITIETHVSMIDMKHHKLVNYDEQTKGSAYRNL